MKVIERGDDDLNSVFTPQWSPEGLRPFIGKAQLLIRPRSSILEKAKELRSLSPL